MARWLLFALVVFVSGCAAMAKVGPGEVTIRESMTVRLDSAWNRLAQGAPAKGEVWTTDGLTLDRLVFYVGIADGEALGELQQRKDRQIPKFRATMQPHEIAEMYEVFVTYDGSTYRRDKLAPAQFAGSEGFRFEFSRLRKGDEVEMRGLGYGTVHGGKLYLMVFEAPRIHYFNKHLGRAEAVAKSARVVG